jgi:hypothetical protein
MVAYPLADPNGFFWSIDLLTSRTRMKRVEPMDKDLTSLIEWAWDCYPPAIALARQDFRPGLPGEGGEQKRIALLVEGYRECLRYYLNNQPEQGHFLARVDTADQGLELYAGGYRWIVDFLPARNQVAFVDYYFFLDHAPPEAFGLDPAHLSRHFTGRPGRWPDRVTTKRPHWLLG